MTFFTLYEILASALHAAIFGAAFALLIVSSNVIFKEIARLITVPREIFCYSGKIFELPNPTLMLKPTGKARQITEGMSVFFSVFLFAVGFILLSYYSLDGSIRLYMLVISVAVMLCSKPLLDKSIFILIDKIFKSIIIALVISLRVLTLPLLKAFILIRKILHRKYLKK